jgi:hypothetical protein
VSHTFITGAKAKQANLSSVRFLPSWFPGAKFKRVALDLGQKLNKVDVVPFNWVKQQIVGFTTRRFSPEF